MIGIWRRLRNWWRGQNFQKDRFILELKSKHQDELQKLTHNQNIEIQEYQNKYKMLLDQLEQMEISKKSKITVVKNKE